MLYFSQVKSFGYMEVVVVLVTDGTPNAVVVSCTRLLMAVSVITWRHNGRGDVSNHQPRRCLRKRSFRRRSKKTTKLRVTGLCVRKSPVTGKFPAQRASNAENVSIWWRYHVLYINLRGKSYILDHVITEAVPVPRQLWFISPFQNGETDHRWIFEVVVQRAQQIAPLLWIE